MDRFKIVISDCHLSAGRFFEGKLNPHEDFFFDDEMADLFNHFSNGKYGQDPDGPVAVELIINGDFFDYLNVAYQGEFEDAITEEIALYKTEAIIAGHPLVMSAIRAFASKPGKFVTYLIGNHDPDLFFPAVRERIIREMDPEGKFPSEKVRILHETDRLIFEEGVEIHLSRAEAVKLRDFLEAYGDESDDEIVAAIRTAIANAEKQDRV